MKTTIHMPRLFDRDLIMWGLVPSAFAVCLVSLFALPNYIRARDLKGDAQLLKAVTSETISAQNNLRTLEGLVTGLREERDRRCRPLGDAVERDRLLNAITRQTDGTIVREQSIRTGQVTPAPGMPGDYQVLRREVTVDMVGSFDAIFGVIDAAEGIDQLVTTRSVELSVMVTPIEQAQTGTGVVRAHIVFEEWFQPPAARPTGAPVQAVPTPVALHGGAR